LQHARTHRVRPHHRHPERLDAAWFLAWHDRRHRSGGIDETGKIANAKRRETLVGLIRASIAMAAFTTATVLAIGQVAGGVDRLGAIAGVSFAVIVAGFATQRVLSDLIAGLTMFLEGWHSVGDPSRTCRYAAPACAR
jgi:small-conductance mechanosensitive channel